MGQQGAHAPAGRAVEADHVGIARVASTAAMSVPSSMRPLAST
jgi:hypothetical protein